MAQNSLFVQVLGLEDVVELWEKTLSPRESMVVRVDEVAGKEKKSLLQRSLKLSEETGELAQAVLSYEKAPGCAHKNKTAADVAEEAIDVAQVALSIALMFLDSAGVEEVMDRKLAKWEKVQQNEH